MYTRCVTCRITYDGGMPRWKPDARQRLVAEALRLFAEQGYDATTVSQIAERAGLTRSTFHRYFGDKRDVLTAGQETLGRLLADGIGAAPPSATPLEAVWAGLERAAAAMTPFNREISPLMRAAVEANRELQEGLEQKHAGLAAAMAEALGRRQVPRPAARIAAEIGVLAFTTGYQRWNPERDDEELTPHLRAAFEELRSAVTDLR